MADSPWEIVTGNSRLIASAIHDGHQIRNNLIEHIALNEEERLREEDPFTGLWTQISDTRIVVNRSRFEVDLNRPRDKAIYLKPSDAWGLNVWKNDLPVDLINQSLIQYDNFYSEIRKLLDNKVKQFGSFIVYDIHTYNHRRSGPNGQVANPEENPEVNVGTGTMDRTHWGSVIDMFISVLRDYDYLGKHLDVRENIKFKGGNFSRWIHDTYPKNGCSIAIEFKKFFMDEWTGKPDNKQISEIESALQSTVTAVLEVLS
jgi:N-formylglutamate deformylase